MKIFKTKEEVIDTIINRKDILIVQDLDGVCIPLVQDPLKREINKEYVKDVSKLREKFAVLTCGEHEGRRGVNRLVEKALNSKTTAKENGFYLPGLAACGVEFQDRFSNLSHPGLKDNEINFLAEVPKMMRSMLTNELKKFLPNLSNELRNKLSVAVHPEHVWIHCPCQKICCEAQIVQLMDPLDKQTWGNGKIRKKL